MLKFVDIHTTGHFNVHWNTPLICVMTIIGCSECACIIYILYLHILTICLCSYVYKTVTLFEITCANWFRAKSSLDIANFLNFAMLIIQRRHFTIKRLHDDPSDEEDNAVMPTRKNKDPHTSSAPSTTSRAKLKNLVKKKCVLQPQSDAKVFSCLSLLGVYSDDSN